MMTRERPAIPDATLSVGRPERSWWWVMLLGVVLALAFQGTRGLWSPDEGRYVDAALQMLDSGNYVAPAYSPDMLNFSKPPMTYWVIAGSLKVLGRNTWAARLPYALAHLATLALLFAMGRRVTPKKPWLAPLIYATTLFTVLTANIISTDVLLTLAEGVAAWGFVMHMWPAEHERRPWARVVMWLGFALAFLTKGPPGLLPLLPMVLFTAMCCGRRATASLFHPLGLLAFVVVGFSWYAMAMVRYPWLAHYFLHDEVYGRIFTNMYKRHAGPAGWIIAFAPVLFIGTFPWWKGLVEITREAFARSSWRVWRASGSIELFLLLWFAVPFIVFCLAKSRLPLYLLPLFIPLSLLAASRTAAWFDPARPSHRWLVIAWVAVLLVAKAVGAYVEVARVDNRVMSREIASIASGLDYRSLVFVHMTTDVYAMEEQTPWGVRLYLDRPVYGIRWQEADAAQQICGAVAKQGRSVLLVDREIPAADLAAAMNRCKLHVQPIGTWRKDVAFLAGA